MTSIPEKPPLPDPSGLEHSLSPVDLPGETAGERGGLGWTTTAIAVASLVLLALNATAIRGWAYELPPGPVAAPVVDAAERWYDLTAALGLNLPVDTMRGWWEGAQDSSWSTDQTPGPAT
ncbi:hypothetical protein [Allosphingosinicella sp.]|uniref:hypothetical protein n=1 Tax=Allosphingosinicella sp. TaxID=2823234 RepID=UPI002EE32993